MGFLQSLLHKRGHDDIALQINVFSEIEPLERRSQAQLDWLDWLSRKRASKRPLSLDIDAHGCVAVRLQSIWKIVEYRKVRYLARHHPPRKILDPVRQLVPDAVVLLRGSMRRRFTPVAFLHERIQVNHFGMGV